MSWRAMSGLCSPVGRCPHIWSQWAGVLTSGAGRPVALSWCRSGLTQMPEIRYGVPVGQCPITTMPVGPPPTLEKVGKGLSTGSDRWTGGPVVNIWSRRVEARSHLCYE